MLQSVCTNSYINMQKINTEINEFFSRYKLLEYKAKEIVIHMSDEPSGVYYVKDGFVKMNTILLNGSELTLNIFRPGSFFPMAWALTDSPNNYLYQTMTKVSLYKAPKKEILDFLKSNSDVLFDLTKRVFSGLDGLMTNITYLVFGSAQNRVVSALLLCSRRFGKREKGMVVINIHLTHQDIANIAGLTRETTSIEIGKLKKENIISQSGGEIVIEDIERLKNFVQVEETSIKPITAL